MRSTHFVLALGIGAAIGGAVALLYAPQTGAASRKKLKRNFEDFGDSLEDAAEYLRDQAERLSKEAERFIEANKDQFEDVAGAAGGFVKSAAKASRSVSKLI